MNVGDPVKFELPASFWRDGRIFRIFDYCGLTFYVISYWAGDEPSFVVRQSGQFKVTE